MNKPQAPGPDMLSRRRFLRLGVYVAPLVVGGGYLLGSARDAPAQSECSACDSDEDGIGDELDACGHSNLASTVVIDGVDTGVPNFISADGCSISDQIAEAAAAANNHGEFVSAVAGLTNGLKSAGVISGKQKGAIQNAAADANIP